MNIANIWHRWSRVVIAVAGIGAVIVASLVITHRGSQSITAHFATATGLYPGDDVKVLGIKVGKVTSITPEDGYVTVSLSVDKGVQIPASASAAIVAPNLVSGRFVQLAPAYTSGPQMSSGMTIPVTRTAVPVSFDEVKAELSDLASALGPGGSTNGSLAAAIKTLNANLANGNDAQLRTTLASLQKAATTLGTGSDDTFATIANIDSFTHNLAVYDGAVTGFTRQLAGASASLDQNRVVLGQALSVLNSTLPALTGFASKHRGSLVNASTQLNAVTANLANQASVVAALLHVVPHSIEDLYYAVPKGGILGRVTLAQVNSLAGLLCGALLGAGGTAANCQTALQPLLGKVLQSGGSGLNPGQLLQLQNLLGGL